VTEPQKRRDRRGWGNFFKVVWLSEDGHLRSTRQDRPDVKLTREDLARNLEEILAELRK